VVDRWLGDGLLFSHTRQTDDVAAFSNVHASHAHMWQPGLAALAGAVHQTGFWPSNDLRNYDDVDVQGKPNNGYEGSKSKTHSVLTHVGVAITAEWRGAAPTSIGRRVVYTRPKPKPRS
jgi:hypothetical protein